MLEQEEGGKVSTEIPGYFEGGEEVSMSWEEPGSSSLEHKIRDTKILGNEGGGGKGKCILGSTAPETPGNPRMLEQEEGGKVSTS